MDLLTAALHAAGYLVLALGVLFGLLVLTICALLVGVDRLPRCPGLFWPLTVAAFLLFTPLAPLALLLAPLALLWWLLCGRTSNAPTPSSAPSLEPPPAEPGDAAPEA